MPKLNEIFTGSYLKADDLKGRSVTVTIEKAEVVEFDDGHKVVVRFVGKDKALVCNKTNANIIAEVTGQDDTDHWAGHSLTLSVKKVEYQGKLVPAIRVELLDSPKKKQPAAAPKPVPAEGKADDAGMDDVPF